MVNNEGWGWPEAAKKAHYFRGAFSLCRAWMFAGRREQGNDDSPDNCKACQKKLALEKQCDRKEEAVLLPYVCNDCGCEFTSALPIDAPCPDCGSENTEVQ